MDYSLLKACATCGVAKPLTAYRKLRRSKDGCDFSCRSCMSTYHRRYYDKNFSKHQQPGDRHAYMRRKNLEHKELVNPLKDLPCVDCGEKFPPACMEFDHVRGDKRHNIGEMTSWKRETILEEVSKCEVVCTNCHRVRTASRRPAARVIMSTVGWKARKAERQREKIDAFREMITAVKADPCSDCSHTFHPAAMDLDHVRGVKLFSISNGWSYTPAEVRSELEKCDLVCACCHRLRTTHRLSIAA